MRPRSARHGNRSPRTAPAGQPRAQGAPRLPQVAERTGGHARTGTHARAAGRLGARRGRQVHWGPVPLFVRHLWACPQVLQSEPQGGCCLCLGVSLAGPSLFLLCLLCLRVHAILCLFAFPLNVRGSKCDCQGVRRVFVSLPVCVRLWLCLQSFVSVCLYVPVPEIFASLCVPGSGFASGGMSWMCTSVCLDECFFVCVCVFV